MVGSRTTKCTAKQLQVVEVIASVTNKNPEIPGKSSAYMHSTVPPETEIMFHSLLNTRSEDKKLNGVYSLFIF